MEPNIILLTDSYKVGHWNLLPPNTEYMYYYLESRGGKYPTTTFFGLQYLIKKYLAGQVVTQDKINKAERRFKQHFGRDDVFNKAGWQYILEHRQGYLPIKIKAVPEGMTVPTSNILLSVENTDPNCYWLPGYLESLFVELWYPITVCTQSREIKKVIKHYMDLTSDNSDAIDYKLHDFGLRGVSSPESAAIGGAAHLVNFKGTDTLPALDLIEDYYGCADAGNSVVATEHSTITPWGRENEVEAYRNLLEKNPNGIIACVSDSYNIYEACEKLWGTELRDKVTSRNGILVIRPDSGDPTEVIAKCIEILGDKFGHCLNSKGYKVLHNSVRLIQGDGVDINSISSILGRLMVHRWSADNVGFGSGGALLQKMDRDTQKFAYKCSAAQINGKWIDVYKEPITDSIKKSKRGRLKLVQERDPFNRLPTDVETVAFDDDRIDILETVYKIKRDNGYSRKMDWFNNIRERVKL